LRFSTPLLVLCAGIAGLMAPGDAAALRGHVAVGGPAGISVMRVDGTHGHKLTKRPWDQGPAWSPNGRKIAFNRARHATKNCACGPYDIYVIGANGRGLRRLLPNGGSAAWAPNGRVLAVDTAAGIEAINADGTGRHRIVDHGVSPTWSPDGTQIAYAGETIDPETGESTGGFVAIVNADGSRNHVIFTSPEKGMPSEPAWSPKGREIAFKREFFTGDPGQIWVVAPTGEGLHKLTGNGENPDWSPDGRHLIYDGFGPGGNYRTYIVRRDGTHSTVLHSCPKHGICLGGSAPDWGP
jgi:Tol biopolymer transport system component